MAQCGTAPCGGCCLQEQNPECKGLGQIAKATSLLWKSASPETLAHYEQLARLEHDKYLVAMEAYRTSLLDAACKQQDCSACKKKKYALCPRAADGGSVVGLVRDVEMQTGELDAQMQAGEPDPQMQMGELDAQELD